MTKPELRAWAGLPAMTTLAVWLVLWLAGNAPSLAAPAVSRFKLLTAPGAIGTLTVTEDGNHVETDYRVDDNGRGPKIKERILLGPDALPQRWEIEGERLAKLDMESEPVQRLVVLMKARKTTLDPTLSVFSQTLLSRPGKECPTDTGWVDHVPVSVQRLRRSACLDAKPGQYGLYNASWKKIEETLVMLYRKGVPLVPGTDDYAGLVLHSELEAWVRACIPASAVLSMATLGAARFAGMDGQVGAVAAGRLADLYLVEGDPTQDIAAPRKGRLVLKGGAIYSPDEIHEALGIKPFVRHAVVTPPSKPASRPE